MGTGNIQPPTDVVAYLFTDIVASTKTWERDQHSMAETLSQHDAIVRKLVDDAGGYVFATTGDGFGVAFFSGPCG